MIIRLVEVFFQTFGDQHSVGSRFQSIVWHPYLVQVRNNCNTPCIFTLSFETKILLAIGPIAGGFITQHTTWRWAFWSVSIADAVIQGFGLFYLRETYPPKLLHNKAKKLRKET